MLGEIIFLWNLLMAFVLSRLIRKAMDVNEYERIPKFNNKTHIKVKEESLYCCSTFHSHSRVFNNEDNSYLLVTSEIFN
jgi:hypothetical protein